MNNFDNLLAIGATSRSLGKTEFICRLLERFHKQSIIAIKIKTQYEGDDRFHGKGGRLNEGYVLREENQSSGLDDSKRLLKSGAKKVFYIKSTIDALGEAVQELKNKYDDSQLFICESNSVLEYYNPGAFIMILGTDKTKYKYSALKFMDRSDIIIKSSGHRFEPDPGDISIRINNYKWTINQDKS